MSWIVYTLAAFGVLLGASLSTAVIWDVHLAKTNKETISEWFMAAQLHMKCLLLLIFFSFGFIWGALLAHLIWASNNSFSWFYIIAVITVVVGLLVGGKFGHHFFGQ